MGDLDSDDDGKTEISQWQICRAQQLRTRRAEVGLLARSVGDMVLRASDPSAVPRPGQGLTRSYRYLGVYALHAGGRALVQGRPYYKLSASRPCKLPLFLYHHNGWWRVGKDVCSHKCWWKARDSAETPDRITAEWRAWSQSAEAWD